MYSFKMLAISRYGQCILLQLILHLTAHTSSSPALAAPLRNHWFALYDQSVCFFSLFWLYHTMHFLKCSITFFFTLLLSCQRAGNILHSLATNFLCLRGTESESLSAVSDSLRPHGLHIMVFSKAEYWSG